MDQRRLQNIVWRLDALMGEMRDNPYTYNIADDLVGVKNKVLSVLTNAVQRKARQSLAAINQGVKEYEEAVSEKPKDNGGDCKVDGNAGGGT